MWIAVALFCTLIEAIFTALEVATNASSRTRLRALAAEMAAEDDELSHSLSSSQTAIEYSNAPSAPLNRALQVLELLETPQRLAWMFLSVTSLTMWTAACAIVWHAARAGWNWIEQIVALASVVFCAEVLPLLIAARHPETTAMRGAPWIKAAIRFLNPLIALLKGAGSLGAKTLGAASSNMATVTPHELRTALATAEEAGVIESDERALLEGAMDFRERHVREVMTPQSEMVVVCESDSLLVALQIAMSESHSRLPVIDEARHIVGIVAAKDLVPFGDELFGAQDNPSAKHRVRDIMRAPLWVEEDAPVANVLEELRRRRSLMAIVRNQASEMVGIVTLEDLLEEIVGEIQDEYDDEAPLMVREEEAESSTRRYSVLCDADVKVREVQRFWRETYDENLHLQLNEEAAPSSLSLREFAVQLLSENTPETASGARVTAGFVILEESDDAAGSDAATFVMELEIVEINGQEIEKVRLSRSLAPTSL